MAVSRALVLFDIDGTLLRRAGSHHKDALLTAVREVTGHDTSFDRIPTGGMLDRDLIRALLKETPARSQRNRRMDARYRATRSGALPVDLP